MRMSLRAAATAAAVIVAISLSPAGVGAAEEEAEVPLARAGHSEIFFVGQWVASDGTKSGNAGTTASIDATGMYGVGLGMNFGDGRLNLNTSIRYGKTNLDLRTPGTNGVAKRTDDMRMFSWDFLVDMNLMKTWITPVISAGVGTVVFESELDSTWEGQFLVAGTVGGGIRADITDHLMLKVLYRSRWVDLDGGGTLGLDGAEVQLGWIF